jgi:hypothetical protein
MKKNKEVYKSEIRLKGEEKNIQKGVSKGKERFRHGRNFWS